MILTRTILTRRFQPVTLAWHMGEEGPLVSRVFLTPPSCSWNKGSCAEIEDLAGTIGEYLGGADIAVPADLADLGSCPAFQRAVLLWESRVPRGSVTTYGTMAQMLGTGARAVGNALARNPFPLMVPCHRTVAANRGLGGFQGGVSMKRALLAMEGVGFDRDGRVSQTVGVWGP